MPAAQPAFSLPPPGSGARGQVEALVAGLSRAPAHPLIHAHALTSAHARPHTHSSCIASTQSPNRATAGAGARLTGEGCLLPADASAIVHDAIHICGPTAWQGEQRRQWAPKGQARAVSQGRPGKRSSGRSCERRRAASSRACRGLARPGGLTSKEWRHAAGHHHQRARVVVDALGHGGVQRAGQRVELVAASRASGGTANGVAAPHRREKKPHGAQGRGRDTPRHHRGRWLRLCPCCGLGRVRGSAARARPRRVARRLPRQHAAGARTAERAHGAVPKRRGAGGACVKPAGLRAKNACTAQGVGAMPRPMREPTMQAAGGTPPPNRSNSKLSEDSIQLLHWIKR